MTESEIKAKILEVLQAPQNQWRTAWGIARDTGIPIEEVEAFLRGHPDLITQSPIAPSGTTLFGSAHVHTQSSSG